MGATESDCARTFVGAGLAGDALCPAHTSYDAGHCTGGHSWQNSVGGLGGYGGGGGVTLFAAAKGVVPSPMSTGVKREGGPLDGNSQEERKKHKDDTSPQTDIATHGEVSKMALGNDIVESTIESEGHLKATKRDGQCSSSH